ncbi:hypothetical protein IGI04_015313 [Brassica rapa subsp. trilocularis]|uniref:Uncharacterized protein n=1 Tax=Brassica rapa subsp. trilocularis TaxID=1813537 RepID=A0ABQ7MS84_BRACM|nr:hypothetical protein IGI04_015313 [Brassica rapa subsp. trilocularis]
MFRLHFAYICLYQVFEYHMEFLETFGCIWSSKESDCTKSLAFSHPETHIDDPGATSQSDLPRSLPIQSDPLERHTKVEGLEGQEELCFINNNGSWYKKEPNFQYNNYQQKSYPNNQQSGYPPRNNQQGSYQPQQNPSSGSSAPQESSTDTLLKQILESQTRSEKHVGYELKNLHTKIDGSYNELNNKFSHLASTSDCTKSLAFSHPETHIDDPGATSQSDLPRSLPIQSDPLERHTKVARDLSPGDTKNRPWSDFPERHLQVAPRYFAAENHDFLRTFLQFILDSNHNASSELATQLLILRHFSPERLKVDSLIDHLPSLVRYLITQGLIPMPMSSLFP